jgi:hypothetical protein
MAYALPERVKGQPVAGFIESSCQAAESLPEAAPPSAASASKTLKASSK